MGAPVRNLYTVTRETQEPDLIYILTDGATCFVTPDGVGRYWYDSVLEAEEQHGDDVPHVYLEVDPPSDDL